MSELKSTKDYHIFKKNEANREIDAPNLKKLTNSIKVQNMLEYRPITVDKNLYIIDGQHRLEAAKVLGIPIFYQINRESEDIDMILLNNTQKSWKMQDYVNYYIKKGYPEYTKFQEYARKTGKDLGEILRYNRSGGSYFRSIREGKLKFFHPEEQNQYEEQDRKCKEFIPHIRKHILSDTHYLDSVRFERALQMLIKNEDVDWDTFVKKATIKSDAFKICATSESYYLLLLDIYNWKNREKIYAGVPNTIVSQMKERSTQLSMTEI